MTISSSVVKKTAKSALTNHWLEAMGVGIIFLFAVFVLYISASLLSVALPSVAVALIILGLMLFILLPLFLGVLRAFWLIMWEKDAAILSVFHYFSSRDSYIKALRLFSVLTSKAVFIGVLLLAPAFITDILSSVKIYEQLGFSAPAWASNLWVVSIFLKAAAGVILALIMLKYYMAPFLIIADEQMDVHEAIHKSTLLSRACATDFVSLIFSFLGWILLSVLAIPLIIILPYFLVSYMVHSRFAVASYNKMVSSVNGVNEKNRFSAEGI